MAESSRDSADIDRYGDKPKSPTHNKTYVIVGGGIAGVSCAEEVSHGWQQIIYQNTKHHLVYASFCMIIVSIAVHFDVAIMIVE